MGINWLVSAVLAGALFAGLGMATKETAAMPAADTVGVGGAACSYATIGDAITAATSGDTIYIAPGTYNEQLGTVDKDLHLTAATADCTAEAPYPTTPWDYVVDAGGAASFNGGVVAIAAGRVVTFSSMMLQNAHAVDGGIVYVESGASATFNRVRLRNGMANNRGGIVYVAPDAVLAINDSSFIEGGNAGNAGGGLYVEGLADFLSGVNVQDSHAPLGGGVAIAGNGHLILGLSQIGSGLYPNSAGRGGGVHMTGNAWLEMYSVSTIRWNDATVDHGGGVYADGNVRFEARGGRIYGNEAVSEGGGIYATNGATVQLEGYVEVGDVSPINGNSAVRGGGIYAGGATSVEIRGSAAVRGNSAGDGGAGLYLDGGAILHMAGGEISGNDAAGWGGGIALADGQVTLDETIIAENEAAEGGGIGQIGNNVIVATNSQIVSNTASLNGGGMALHGGIILMSDSNGTSRLSGNQAGQHGGGFYHAGNGGGSFTADAGWASLLRIEGNAASGHGGGLYSDNSGSAFLVGNVRLADNVALGDGGGWYQEGGMAFAVGTAIDQRPEISGNRSENGRGGGVYLTDVASGPGDSAPFGNLTIDGNWADSEGGGLYVANGSHVLLVNARVDSNEAGQDGGGVLASASRLEVWQHDDGCANALLPANQYCSEFRNNAAPASGGAIRLELAAELTMERTALIGNSAATGSGVMSASNGDHLEITNSLFAGNTGKALFLANDAFLDLVQTTFAGNEWAIDADDNGATVNADNNIVWGNGFGVESEVPLVAGCSIVQNGVGGLIVDPLFHSTGRGDYRLQAGSPAIDVCGMGADVDLDGIARPQGTDYDMGAFEAGRPFVLLPAQVVVAEGNAGVTPALVTVALTEPSAATITMDVTTVDVRATAGADYNALAETITFPAGTISQTVAVEIAGDVLYEGDEQLAVQLANASGAELVVTATAVLIADDDPLPSVTVVPADADEGDSGTTPATLAVSLSHPSAFTVTVDFATSAGTATPGSDYVETSGTVTFAPGEVAGEVAVPVTGDTDDEPDETFQVILADPDGATLAPGGAQAMVTIVDDDETEMKVFLPLLVR